MTAKDPMKGAARVLDLIEAFGDRCEPMSLTEISQTIDVPISSCHALVKTLHQRGYVYRLDSPKRFYPTRRLTDIARRISHGDQPLLRLATAVEQVSADTGETTIIAKLQDEMALYLDVIDGSHTVRYAASPGEQRPAHASAAGKALLSLLDRRDFEAALDHMTLRAVTGATITDRTKLMADIADGKSRGYFLSCGETVEHVMGIAIAIRFAGEAFAVGIAGPLARLEDRRDMYVERLGQLRADLHSIDV